MAGDLNFDNVDELIAAVGYAHITPRRILNRLYAVLHPDDPPLSAAISQSREKEKDREQPLREARSEVPRKAADGVSLSDGVDGVLMRFAKCCNPVPGDPVIGYISRGMGITVHRVDCPNVANMEPERLISVHWDGQEEKPYDAAVFIIAENQPGVLAQVAAELARQEININEIACKSLVDGRTELRLTIQVRNASQLYGSIELIRKLPHILEVVRDTDE